MNPRPIWFVPVSVEYRPLLLKHFLPSLVETGMAGKVDLAVIDIPPMATSGFRRFDGIIPLLESPGNYGRRCIISGADIRFYRDFLDSVFPAHDCLSTSLDRTVGGTVLCSDFLAFTINWRTLSMFDSWENENTTAPDDQVALNTLFGDYCDQSILPPLSHIPLTESFWTIGLGGIPRTWVPGDAIPEPPADIAMHHSNFTVGIENKLALLDAVRARVEQSKSS